MKRTYLNAFSPEPGLRALVRDVDGGRSVADESLQSVQPVIGRHGDAEANERRQSADGRRRAQHRLLRAFPHHARHPITRRATLTRT